MTSQLLQQYYNTIFNNRTINQSKKRKEKKKCKWNLSKFQLSVRWEERKQHPLTHSLSSSSPTFLITLPHLLHCSWKIIIIFLSSSFFYVEKVNQSAITSHVVFHIKTKNSNRPPPALISFQKCVRSFPHRNDQEKQRPTNSSIIIKLNLLQKIKK